MWLAAGSQGSRLQGVLAEVMLPSAARFFPGAAFCRSPKISFVSFLKEK